MRQAGTLLLAAASLCVALSGCSNTNTVQVQPAVGGSSVIQPWLDYVAPEQLLEVPPANETQRQQFRLRQATPVCVSLSELAKINQPNPTDAQSLVTYSHAYWAMLAITDRSSKVRQPGNPNHVIVVPTEVVDQVDAAQREVYAYDVRVTSVESLRSQGVITDAQAQTRLDTAWVQLVNSGFMASDQALSMARQKYCG